MDSFYYGFGYSSWTSGFVNLNFVHLLVKQKARTFVVPGAASLSSHHLHTKGIWTWNLVVPTRQINGIFRFISWFCDDNSINSCFSLSHLLSNHIRPLSAVKMYWKFLLLALATSVGGDSPGELFTQILTLLLFDDSRSYRIGYKTPSSSSWCRRSSFRSSQRRSVATATTSSSPNRQSPEAMETTAEASVEASEPSPPPTVEAEPQDKSLLRLLGSFVDLFFVYSETGTSSASSTSTVVGGSSSSKQVFREVWDWQYQCGRGGGSEDERPRRRRGKRFATVATSTTTSTHYRNSCPLLHRQEAKFTLAKGFTDAAGAAGGLKSLLASLVGDIEDEPASTSPPRKVEASAGSAISEEGEFEDNWGDAHRSVLIPYW